MNGFRSAGLWPATYASQLEARATHSFGGPEAHAASYVVAISLLLSLASGCSATKPDMEQSRHEAQVSLEELLAHLPARDAAEQRWIGEMLVDSAPESIVGLCARLDTLPSGSDARVRYALSGSTAYATLPGHETDRTRYASALSAALGAMRSPLAKSFVIEQLQIAGGPESVGPLSSLLADEMLCEPAAMALVAIRTPEAALKILEAVRALDGSRKITLVKALGDSQSREAVPDLMTWASGDDTELSVASGAALAAIGDPRSAGQIKSAPLQLAYAQRLAENGNAELSERICRTLLSATSSDSAPHIHAGAIRQLADLLGERALNDVVAAAQGPGTELRGAALDIASGMKGEGVTERWLSVMQQGDSGLRASIVRMLGRRKDTAALPAVCNALTDKEPVVRIAAVEAAAGLGGTDAFDSILVLLERTERADEIAAVRDAVLPLPPTQTVPAAIRVLNAATPQAKIMLLQFLADCGSLVPFSAVLPLANDGPLPVRLAAIKTLENVATPADMPDLVKMVMETKSEGEWSAIQRALAATAARNPDAHARADALLAVLESASGEGNVRLIRTLGRIGGTKALRIVTAGISSKDPAVKDASMRALAEWPDIEGFDALLAVARSKQPLATRVLAVRGSQRMVNEAGLPPNQSARLLGSVLAASERPEEQRLVLASLGKSGSREGFRIASEYLGDDAVGLDAALAMRKLAGAGEEKPKEGMSADVVRVFIERNASPKVLQQLEKYDEARSDLNRPPEGFVALFNGKDHDGWKGLVADPPTRQKMTADELAEAQAAADSIMRAHWSVEDGVLVFDGKGASLCTAKDYANFELLVDWKIEKKGDSGIYLRGSPQVQIWDTAIWPEGSGGLYNNQKNPSKPLQKADRPIGEWNTFRIRMVGERVTVHLNDVLVVDNVVLENYWEREKPIYPAGQIELQSHESPLYFRNIFIRELPPEEEPFSGLLFNGRDLTGWEPVGGSTPWGVTDSVLYTEGGGGGWISTVEEYANFTLDLEFRVPEGGNSGVFLRTPRDGDPAYVGMEVQVLDDYAPVYANLHPWQYTGSIYGVQAPSVRASKKAGEWQHMVIVADGPHMTVTLNGQRIVDADLVSHMDLEHTHPGLKRRKGYIGLQNHSTKIEYRNIHITELK